MTIETIPHNVTQRARVYAMHQWHADDVEHIVLAFSTVRTDDGAVRHLVPHEQIDLRAGMTAEEYWRSFGLRLVSDGMQY